MTLHPEYAKYKLEALRELLLGKELYDECNTGGRLTNLFMSMVVDPRQPLADWAHLRVVQAGGTRHLVPLMALIDDGWATKEEEKGQPVVVCVRQNFLWA